MKGKKTMGNSIARSGTTAGAKTKANLGKTTGSSAKGQASIGNTWGKCGSSNANLKGGTGAKSAG